MSRGLVERAIGLGVPRESILHLPNAADLVRFRPRDKSALRAQLGYSAEGFRVGFASMDSFFDLEPVLEGFAQLTTNAGDARLLMIGRVHQHIKDRVDALGLTERTDYSGFVSDDDYPLHLSACDAFVMPFPETNYNIGRWPNKFGEYVASGRPVVFNPIGDLADFAGAGAPGLTCGFSADEFARALARLYDDPALATRLGEQARKTAMERLDWSERIDRLETLYQRLDAKRTARPP